MESWDLDTCKVRQPKILPVDSGDGDAAMFEVRR